MSTHATALDPLVSAVIADFQALHGGPRLSETALNGWFEKIRVHPERARLAAELLVVAGRFFRAGAREAVAQTVTLAVAAAHPDLARRALEDAGAAAEEVERTVGAAEVRSRRLSDGLSRPSGGGVGLRRRPTGK